MAIYSNTTKEIEIKSMNELPKVAQDIVLDITTIYYNDDNDCCTCKIPIQYYKIISKFLKDNFGYITKINGTLTKDYCYDTIIYFY